MEEHKVPPLSRHTHTRWTNTTVNWRIWLDIINMISAINQLQIKYLITFSFFGDHHHTLLPRLSTMQIYTNNVFLSFFGYWITVIKLWRYIDSINKSIQFSLNLTRAHLLWIHTHTEDPQKSIQFCLPCFYLTWMSWFSKFSL